jgi:xanthine dehydrogenase accessory factor
VLETIDAQGGAALVSILDTAGSAPREAGARMVVRPDGGFWGTVGGGALEHQLIEAAGRALQARAAAQLRDVPLGPDLGQCCGGRVTTLVETFARQQREAVAALAESEARGPFETRLTIGEDGVRREPTFFGEPPGALARGVYRERFGEDAAPLLLFGAGHVGRAVVLALAPLPFRVRWIDSRPEAFPHHVPANTQPVLAAGPAAEIAAAPRGALVLIMTHSHPLDLDVASAALRRGDLGFVGLIGSQTKKARFLSRMRAAGLAEPRLAGLTCPIGVPGVGGKEPAVIAASVAVQLLQVREQMRHTALDLRAGSTRAGHHRNRLSVAGGRP